MSSPYTKHLDATLDHPTSVPMVPTYAAPPAQPMVVHQQSATDSGSGKAGIILFALVAVIMASAAGYMIARGMNPSWNELSRYEALAGREGEIKGRDTGWTQGRTQGRTEMEYLAKYEQLKTDATAFNQGFSQGLGTGRMVGKWEEAPYRYSGRGYGYGGYYGGSVGTAVSTAQNLANATGQEVDVAVN